MRPALVGWRSRRRGGRPRISADLIALIARISAENPTWGAPRIHGELLKLGFRVAQSTVSKYIRGRPNRPGTSWRAFLAAHGPQIAAVDLFTVRTLGFELLYAVVVLAHDRRRIIHIEVASRPTALWLALQVRLAFSAGPCPPILIRDNDRLHGRSFRDEVRALGLDDRPTQIASPWQKCCAERLIGSIRRECLNHIIVLNAAHLRRVLRAYADYYNHDRPHLTLGKDSPLGRPVERHGRVVSRSVAGGLHRRYHRSAPK